MVVLAYLWCAVTLCCRASDKCLTYVSMVVLVYLWCVVTLCCRALDKYLTYVSMVVLVYLWCAVTLCCRALNKYLTYVSMVVLVSLWCAVTLCCRASDKCLRYAEAFESTTLARRRYGSCNALRSNARSLSLVAAFTIDMANDTRHTHKYFIAVAHSRIHHWRGIWYYTDTVGSHTFNVSGPRIWNGLPEDVLFRRQHFQVSGADLNPSSSSSDILILSSNCTFDTIVVLVVIMFIT